MEFITCHVRVVGGRGGQRQRRQRQAASCSTSPQSLPTVQQKKVNERIVNPRLPPCCNHTLLCCKLRLRLRLQRLQQLRLQARHTVRLVHPRVRCTLRIALAFNQYQHCQR